MSARDDYSNFRFYQEIEPGAKTSAQTGNSIDRQEGQNVTFLVNIDFQSNIDLYSAWFFRMQHGDSDTDGSILWSNVQESQMLYDRTNRGLNSNTTTGYSQTTSTGSGTDEGVCIHLGISVTSDTDYNSTVLKAAYKGNRRWVRVMLSQSTAGDVSQINCGVTAMVGGLYHWAVDDINRV